MQASASERITRVVARVLDEELVEHELLAVFVELDFFVFAVAAPGSGGFAGFVVGDEDGFGGCIEVDEVEGAGQLRIVDDDALSSKIELGELRARKCAGFCIEKCVEGCPASLGKFGIFCGGQLSFA